MIKLMIINSETDRDQQSKVESKKRLVFIKIIHDISLVLK